MPKVVAGKIHPTDKVFVSVHRKPKANFALRADIKKSLVSNLRSGKYKQTSSHLYVPDQGHCCLGVLCEVAGVERDAIKHMGFPQDLQNFKTIFGYTPDATDTDVEGDGGAWMVMHKGKMKPLSELNDGGMSFKEIANIIDLCVETY